MRKICTPAPRHLLAAVVLGLSIHAAAAASEPTTKPSTTPYPAGLSVHNLPVGTQYRTFALHVPPSLKGPPRAVVVVLHGGGGIGMGISRQGQHPLSVFSEVADREGFIVAYPQGSPALDGRAGWSDCRADDRTHPGNEDFAYLAMLLEHLGRAWNLPASRRFMAGGSNGAMMTQGMAIAHPELLGGVASAGGSLPRHPKAGACAQGPIKPVPILLVHGSADRPMPYGGGCVADLNGRCTRGQVLSAEATRDRWLEANGLSAVAPVRHTIERETTDAGPAHRHDHLGAHPVQWWRLEGAGHAVPSQRVQVPGNRETGVQNRDVEFAEIAWAFFKQQLAEH